MVVLLGFLAWLSVACCFVEEQKVAKKFSRADTPGTKFWREESLKRPPSEKQRRPSSDRCLTGRYYSSNYS